LEKSAVLGEIKKPIYTNNVMLALREKGNEFENRFLEELRKEGKSIFEVISGDPEAYSKTLKAMQAGFDVIYQARLGIKSQWEGWADFLIKVEGKSDFGNYSYEVMDTKLATETKAATIIQISLYSEAVGELQGKRPEFMWVKTPENQIQFRLDDYAAYVRLIQSRFLQAIQIENSETYPEPVSHCDICTWWEGCNLRRRQDDHLSFVAGMGGSQIKEVKSHSISTLENFARTASPIPFSPSKGAVQTYQKLRDQANIQWRSREDGYRPLYEFLEIEPEKGFFRLPLPTDFDIYLDLEGDPLVEPGGLEYMIGWYYQGEYYALWSKNEEEEKANFEQFMDLVMEIKSDHPQMHIYHYAPYEVSAFKRLMGKYGTRENEMDGLLRSGTFVDLYGVVRQSIRASVEKYSIKDLEIFYGFERAQQLRELSKHKATYEFLLETDRVGEASEEMREALRLYNMDDCISTQRLQEWLELLRQECMDKGVTITRPEEKSMEATDNITAHQERIQPLITALLQDVPVNTDERTPLDQGRFILAHMLDWYRREQKSFWWEYFRLLELGPIELLEERKAIALLTYTNKRVPEKKSFLDTYLFPSQDSDVKEGDMVVNELGQTAGVVFSLMPGSVVIKKGPSMDLTVHPQAIIDKSQIKTEVKEKAIIQLAEWVVSNGLDSPSPEYRAARELLLRKLPSTTDAVSTNSDLVEFAKGWASKLDHSYLPIQGPPGSGKSYTASHMILDLILKKKKVGITALSHKVITALMQKVWDLATEQGISINAIQKVTTTENRAWTEITDQAKFLREMMQANLIGGTSFLWAAESLANTLDYLFVDEAGQLSLIDTLATAQATQNLILLGDPQQLQQPQQGVHPEGTEVSALAHLLQGNQVIQPEQGIFLDKTWRMNPSICAYDSELFYEGKLHSIPGLENQLLHGHYKITGSGLRLIPLLHERNTNSSVEEVEMTVALVQNLISGTVAYQDKKGQSHQLTENDIKIISPYNAQVNLLKEALPGIEIGTVDKFQGQEAPVVIYSVATSTPQDAPRGMEFLYSPNRLNVAVSRAKAMFILIASPAIFEPDCKSPAQIKLANPFCRFVELAEEIK
jgi:uncharacterized protein